MPRQGYASHYDKIWTEYENVRREPISAEGRIIKGDGRNRVRIFEEARWVLKDQAKADEDPEARKQGDMKESGAQAKKLRRLIDALNFMSGYYESEDREQFIDLENWLIELIMFSCKKEQQDSSLKLTTRAGRHREALDRMLLTEKERGI